MDIGNFPDNPVTSRFKVVDMTSLAFGGTIIPNANDTGTYYRVNSRVLLLPSGRNSVPYETRFLYSSLPLAGSILPSTSLDFIEFYNVQTPDGESYSGEIRIPPYTLAQIYYVGKNTWVLDCIGASEA